MAMPPVSWARDSWKAQSSTSCSVSPNRPSGSRDSAHRSIWRRLSTEVATQARPWTACWHESMRRGSMAPPSPTTMPLTPSRAAPRSRSAASRAPRQRASRVSAFIRFLALEDVLKGTQTRSRRLNEKQPCCPACAGWPASSCGRGECRPTRRLPTCRDPGGVPASAGWPVPPA